ncbi:MAG: hypothetical protein BroJett040_13170 [Oligoflexia bacterium]|nr:MAG: hypothetical protein BroJett040_13170 [Oligoflexia bacterium]
MHMNNGRYLTIMDLGRTDLMMRTGLGPKIIANKWFPVVGSILTSFRAPLNPFDKYTLHTKVLGWDEKWFYLEQKFTKQGAVTMVAVVKALIRNKNETIPTKKVIDSIAPGLLSPTLPDAVQKWLDAEKFFAHTKRDH